MYLLDMNVVSELRRIEPHEWLAKRNTGVRSWVAMRERCRFSPNAVIHKTPLVRAKSDHSFSEARADKRMIEGSTPCSTSRQSGTHAQTIAKLPA